MRRTSVNRFWKKMGNRTSLLLIAVIYIAVVAVSNLLVDKFINVGVFGLLSAGTLSFGLTFTLRDLAHQSSVREKLGRAPIFWMIGAAAIVNLIVAVLVGTPLRFLVASFSAIIISEGADTEIYHRLQHRSWLVRVISSNSVSVPLDSIVFTLVAFLGEPTYGALMLLQIIEGDLLFKYSVGIVLAFVKTAWNRFADPRSLVA
jgi:uncharacterized PurR-regulated membrane protein YhhQ (DUF165 family)